MIDQPLDAKYSESHGRLSRPLLLLMWSMLSLMPAHANDDGRPEKPNIVLILTDDLGWQDVKCYDVDRPSPYETPNIDALAKKGVMFWQGYSPAPTCAPTRCAIMSGNHPARAQKTHVVGGAPPAPYNRAMHRMIPPWYSGRMPADEITLSKVFQQNGYYTGHAGKWHMAINHNAYPQPKDQGFDYTRSAIGATRRMTPHRLTGFATDEDGDPFKLDSNGYPYHQNSEDALDFLRQHKEKPFFFYYATWMVHTPIHTRSKARLEKYCKKLGVELPENPGEWKQPGQTNPFYCAMVEELDYYVGQFISYLETTDDPRWPGHKLIENTYLFFTSDNGGMEKIPGEIITDNYPLDRGKISAREGGVRVPFIVTGPDIAKNVQSDVMVNGLDFYPTFLSLAGIARPNQKSLDGCDLSMLLRENPKDPKLVRHADGKVRDTMVWHFPNSVAMESTIRMGDYKLIRKYDHLNNRQVQAPLQLFQLYDSKSGQQKRVDIEEANDLAKQMPEKAEAMNQKLTTILTEMKASYPYQNPHYKHQLEHKEKVPEMLSHHLNGSEILGQYRENGAKVVKAQLMYTENGGARYEEWFRTEAELLPYMKLMAKIPEGATHVVLNIIDENGYLVSYPEMPDALTVHKKKLKYSQSAISVSQ